ncbi:MAG: very short patch repair endonuclease [Planctomycetota bacterium]
MALSRSQVMARVRASDTRPERVVRSIVHNLGYRFRLDGRHRGQKLPGKPDLVLARLRAAIFVHGCFWHQHDCPRGDRRPATNAEYWNAKLQRNIERDARVQRKLRSARWRVLVVWECELKDADKLRRRIRAFLQRSERAVASP